MDINSVNYSSKSSKLKKAESKLDIARKKPYMRENERLTQDLQNESKFSDELTKKFGKLSDEYIELHKSYKKLEKENNSLLKEKTSLEKENSSKFRKIKELEMQMGTISQEFLYKLKSVYVSVKNIVQAVGMLKYDNDDGYRIENITDKQERLIDGVAEYGSALVKKNEYSDLTKLTDNLAKQMDDKVGIDESLESFVKLPEQELT